MFKSIIAAAILLTTIPASAGSKWVQDHVENELTIATDYVRLFARSVDGRNHKCKATFKLKTFGGTDLPEVVKTYSVARNGEETIVELENDNLRGDFHNVEVIARCH